LSAPVAKRHRTRFEALWAVVLAVVACPTDEASDVELERLKVRVRMAALRYADKSPRYARSQQPRT